MGDPSGGDPDVTTWPPNALYRPPIERIGAALWVLALVSVLVVGAFLDPAEIGFSWRTVILTGLRVFAGVFAFFAVFPVVRNVRFLPTG
ncbi:hypothetical protein DM2_693 [Halorubrum sp. DM2]|uniref:hypothetical protein n=1 Tax=unclassified Halorubrum TaxID=2642239 RepID=UPI0003DD5E12|nr:MULTISPECIES: hypothetical protein [unclassified Halorubrum]CDK39412.1 hypothetical protein BN903_186 [Halorubrum sp. AJ67]VTT87359.1 hypothetical protein DM2_693 [Halorubrum sp. DM2]